MKTTTIKSVIKLGNYVQKTSTEILSYKPIYFFDCNQCSFKSASITFNQAVEVKNEHDEVDHNAKQFVDVIQISMKDIFRPDQFFTYEKYLLYKEKTDELQALRSYSRCACNVCQICWNSVSSITSIEYGVFEQVQLTMTCLDCFVICGDRKQGW